MSEASTFLLATKRYAVVTGGNKGIGLEICRQLASKGVTVVLGSRDTKRGTEAVDKLKDSGVSDNVVFHQLDVMDPDSIVSLTEFVKTQFGKLDILVNNAGVTGNLTDADAVRAIMADDLENMLRKPAGKQINWKEITTQTYELAEECLKINYYGAKQVTEALLPLLKLSDSAKIVNVSSTLGQLKYLPEGWAKEVLGDAGNLTEEKIDEVLNKFLEDFKEGSFETKGWPAHLAAYKVSKAALNALTRVEAKKNPTFCINCICPGFVKTDLTFNTGSLSAVEGGESPVLLALQPNQGQSGLFFQRKDVASFE